MSYLRVYEYSASRSKHFRVLAIKGDRHVGGGGKRGKNEFKLDESLSRTRRTIRDLILCNHFEYFCTFTFSDPEMRIDYGACKKALLVFFKNFRNRVAPAFKYLVVPERHKDGAWHFHGLVSGIPLSEFSCPDFIQFRDRVSDELISIPNSKNYVRWNRYSDKFGFFDCSIIKNYDACAMYVSKYITKDLVDLGSSSHLYFASKGLLKPDLVFDADNVPFPESLGVQYEDEFCRISWASSSQVVGFILPVWHGELASDLSDSDDSFLNLDRGDQEKYIFEPLSLFEI